MSNMINDEINARLQKWMDVKSMSTEISEHSPDASSSIAKRSFDHEHGSVGHVGLVVREESDESLIADLRNSLSRGHMGDDKLILSFQKASASE